MELTLVQACRSALPRLTPIGKPFHGSNTEIPRRERTELLLCLTHRSPGNIYQSTKCNAWIVTIDQLMHSTCQSERWTRPSQSARFLSRCHSSRRRVWKY